MQEASTGPIIIVGEEHLWCCDRWHMSIWSISLDIFARWNDFAHLDSHAYELGPDGSTAQSENLSRMDLIATRELHDPQEQKPIELLSRQPIKIGMGAIECGLNDLG